jgi:hypothetical protein
MCNELSDQEVWLRIYCAEASCGSYHDGILGMSRLDHIVHCANLGLK